MSYKYDKKLASLAEEQFVSHTINPYLYHHILVSLPSDSLAVKVVCQRLRWIKNWPDDGLRLDMWVALKNHLDSWSKTGDNILQFTLQSVINVGINEAIPFFMNGIQTFSPQLVCCLLQGLTVEYRDAGWCVTNLTPGNCMVLKSWIKTLIAKTPVDSVYGYAVESMKCFATEDNLTEIIPYLVEAFETPRKVSDANALIALKILVKTFGKEKVFKVAEPLYEKSDSKERIEKAIDTWLDTTYLRNKSSS